MKKNVFILPAVIFASVLFVHCGKDCAREECPNVKPGTFGFRLVNTANKDLLIGSAKMYETSQVEIKTRKTAGATLENVNCLFSKLNDSSIMAGFSVDKTFYMYYLQLNNTITDSMAFGYNSRFSACCDLSSYYLSRFNTTAISDFALPGTYFIRK